MQRVEIRLLGSFAVTVDGAPIAPEAFAQRRAADLVKVLALEPSHRLTRDEVVERLWPHLEADAGAANLHKAAHYARRALGSPEAVVLRQGSVLLAPGADVTTDVERFVAGDDDAYGGELLPDDRYEEWTLPARDRLAGRRSEVLRRQGRWEEILADDPTDEEAHREIMRARAATGDRVGVARQFRVLRDELARIGVTPSPDTVALHAALCCGPAVQVPLGPGGVVLGRDDELARASQLIASAADGRGSGLLVLGDAGIGKTRLVDAVLMMAAQRGWHTVRATAHDRDARMPYAPLAEALEPLIAGRPDLVARLSDGVQRVVGLLSPNGPRSTTTRAAGHEVLASIGGLVAAAAQDHGLLLAVEDLHVADDATINVLRYLAGAARRERLVVVMTARPAEGGDALQSLRHRLLEQRAGVELTLQPLSDGEIRRLVRLAAGHGLADTALEEVVQAAAGNPFFAEELAAAVDDHGDVQIPERLQDLLDARLDRLSDAARDLMPTLAATDDRCTTADIVGLTGMAPEAATAVLEAAARAGLLVRSPAGWRFRHPLLRDAARRRVPIDALHAAHARAADYFSSLDAPPERVAAHLLACGRERDAVPLLRAAASAAAEVGAYADGERWVDLALRHAAPALRAELLELLGDLRQATGSARAPATYAAARAAAPGARAAALLLKEARALMALGELRDAEAALAAMPDDPALAHDRSVTKGMIAWYSGRFDDAQACADEAASHLPVDPQGRELLWDLKAMVAHSHGRWARTMESQLAEVWHAPQLAGRVLDSYLCVTEYVLHAGDPAERLIDFARNLRDQAHAAGARRGIAFAATVLGEAHLLAGDPARAREHLTDGVRLSREVGTLGGESLARTRLAEALAALGDRAGARAQLDEAVEIGQVSSLAQHVLFLAYAPLVLLPDDPDEAMVLVDRGEALLDAAPSCAYCPAEYYVSAAIACARGGDVPRGRRFVERAEIIAGRFAGAPRAAPIAEARGELLLAEGRAADAEAAFLRAAGGYAARGHRLHEQRVRRALAAHA